MSYVSQCNEIDVFHAVRLGHWDDLAGRLAENAKQSLEWHKSRTLSSRSSHRYRELKAEGVLLPNYPMMNYAPPNSIELG